MSKKIILKNKKELYEVIMAGEDFNKYDYSLVNNMSDMFFNETSDIPSLSMLNVSNVTNMNSMFENSLFNQDISSWDVSNVTDMSFMFQNTPFNQDIGNWDVSNVIYTGPMFKNTPFNQNISNWINFKPIHFLYMFKSCDFSLKEFIPPNLITIEYLFKLFNDPEKCIKIIPTYEMLNTIKTHMKLDSFQLKYLETKIL